MQKSLNQQDDAAILRMKAAGLSFSHIALALEKSIGSVTGRYYRLKGVLHPAQIKRDADLKRQRAINRASRKRIKTLAALEAAIAVNRGDDFISTIAAARRSGSTFSEIGTCLGISGSAVHKKWQAGMGRLRNSQLPS
jgi:hypothetical protein